MTQRHAIELALDLARMPALGRSAVAPPIPPNVTELMRIAAQSSSACQDAIKATGESELVVIQAARFYLQQSLFRQDADSYRILGIQPGAPRSAARGHMRLLLLWLHPDRNDGLDSVYADRVLKAWREVAAGRTTAGGKIDHTHAMSAPGEGNSAKFRLPWIQIPIKRARARTRSLPRRLVVPAGLLIVALALWSAVYYLGSEHTAALTTVQ